MTSTKAVPRSTSRSSYRPSTTYPHPTPYNPHQVHWHLHMHLFPLLHLHLNHLLHLLLLLHLHLHHLLHLILLLHLHRHGKFSNFTQVFPFPDFTRNCVNYTNLKIVTKQPNLSRITMHKAFTSIINALPELCSLTQAM